MNPFPSFLLALALSLVTASARAQTIPNPSFEADHYLSGVGYVSQNGGVITGWAISDTNHAGLNLNGVVNPGLFVNNGAIPDGTNVAFVQTQGGTNTLSTTISNLIAGAAYRVTFHANCRAGYALPVATWSLNNGPYVPFTCAPAVGSTNAYYTNSGAFAATSATASLALQNGTNLADGVDATVIVDDFTIAQILVVSNLNDSGAGSLRQAVLDAAAVFGAPTITFAPALSGAAITLSSGQITISTNLTIDASGLTNGLGINGNHASRIFRVTSGSTVALNWLTLSNGYLNGQSLAGGDGGGIINSGTLTLNRCTVAGNASTNSFLGGGGLANEAGGSLTLNECTLAGNTTDKVGGGIENAGSLTVTECTIALNHSGGHGGGVEYDGGSLALMGAVLAGNTATASAPDLDAAFGAPIATNCLIGDGSLSAVTNSVNANLVGTAGSPINAFLASLGNYGGPSPTMPPLPGSPAIDALATGSSFATDQRGFTRIVGLYADIGAVESGNPIPGFTPVVNISGDVVNPVGAGGVSLRAATAFATNNSTITFASGLSGKTITLTNGQLLLNQSFTIDGSSLAGGVTLSGNHKSRVFQLGTNLTVTLNALTLANGSAPGGTFPANGGGAILNSGLLTLNTCVLQNNQATNGSFSGGGGIENYRGTLAVSNCTFSGNAAAYGGGIDNEGGMLLAFNSTFSSNAAAVAGGAACNSNAATSIAINCTLAGNSATNAGGGIANYATFAITNCTVSSNSASTAGGGIYSGGGSLAVLNTILAGNAAPAAGQQIDVVAGVSMTNHLDLSDPLLGPLGNYGGPTQTMPPLPGSPAIDAGLVIAGLATDQRGYPRVVGPAPDVGAVEFQGSPVVINADSGAGSLRYAIAYAANNATITFADSLSGSAITLTNGQFLVTNHLAVDASSLANGVFLNGNHASRVFQVNSGGTLMLTACTITNGYAGAGNAGGAIQNSGTLTLARCTFTGNAAAYAGAINNNATCILSNCTLFGNTAAPANGGAIANTNGALLNLLYCTFYGNTASGTGGGIDNHASQVNFTNSILAGNTSQDLYNWTNSTVNAGGSNIVQSLVNAGGAVNGSNYLITANPLLAAPGNYGGPTQTMPPLLGSLAVDRATGPTLATDQRGVPRPLGLGPDIGAVEGIYNAAGPGKLTGATQLGNGSFSFGFTNYADTSCTVLATTNLALPLGEWSDLGAAVQSPVGSGQFQFTDPQATNNARRFYRVSSP